MISPRETLVFLAALLGLLCRGGPDPVPVERPEAPMAAPSVRLDRRAIDAAVVDAMRKWNVPGAAVVVIHGDRVEYLAGHGVREVGKPDRVTPDTIFPLASCSKAFTAAALARLVDEGKASWDDPVRKYLPWFRLGDADAARAVTLRDLLCHRTGVASHDLLWFRAPWSPEEAVRRLRHLPLTHPFRSTMQYQSTMVTAAGLAVAAAAGEPWGAVIQDRLLGPLGMKRTLTVAPAASEPNQAWPHRLSAGAIAPIARYPLDRPNAAGSIHSTARDLAAWLRLNLGEGTFQGRQIISREQMRQLWTPQVVIQPSPSQAALFPATRRHAYGLGWVLHDHENLEIVAHGGAVDGFRIHLALVPARQLALAVLTNLDQTPMPHALASTLIDQILALPPHDWHALHLRHLQRGEEEAREASLRRLASRTPGSRPPRPLSAYAGTYGHPAYDEVRIVLMGDRLFWRWRGEEVPLAYLHDDVFSVTSELLGTAELTFRGRDGKVVAVGVTGRLGVTLKKVPG